MIWLMLTTGFVPFPTPSKITCCGHCRSKLLRERGERAGWVGGNTTGTHAANRLGRHVCRRKYGRQAAWNPQPQASLSLGGGGQGGGTALGRGEDSFPSGDEGGVDDRVRAIPNPKKVLVQKSWGGGGALPCKGGGRCNTTINPK